MDLMDYRRKIIMSSPHLSHAEGAVATFADGTDLPLKSLVVQIDPVQDLRGQASPYPAGGSTNLLKSTPYGSAYNGAVGIDLKTVTTNVMDYSVQSDGKVAIDVTATWKGRLFATDALSAGTYSFRLWTYASNVRATWYVTDSDLVVTEMVNNQSSAGWGNVLTRTVTEGQRIALSLSSSTVATINTEFQVNTGSTIAPIVPFENICPISGWTGVNVQRDGINLWDEQLNVGALNSRGNIDSNLTARITTSYIHIKPNTNYYVSSPCVGGRYAYYDAGKNLIAYDGNGFSTNVITSPSDAHYMRITIKSSYGTSYNHDISINYPSTDYSYHPYTGTSVTIDLGQTVYGGTLNVLSGVLTITTAKRVYDGTNNKFNLMSNNGTYKFITDTSFVAQAVATTVTNIPQTLWCNMYNPKGIAALGNTFITGGYFRVCADTSYESVADFNTFLQSNPIEYVYTLTAPIEIQLDAHTLNSLYGQNNIFADTGNVALDYWAHP